MINYILHVSLLLGLGFILYQVLLKKETFYALNRIILFSYLVLAFVLPSIHIPSDWSLKSNTDIYTTALNQKPKKSTENIPLAKINTEDGASITTRDTNNKITSVTTPNDGTILTHPTQKETIAVENQPKATLPSAIKLPIALKWIYIVGFGIFLINFLVQFGILVFYRIKYPSIKDGKMTIVEMPGDKAPFSFLNMIYINPTKYDYETYEQILKHEKIHITKWHSLDIFISELALIVQWFNPFAWYYRKAVEHNLEYLTDQEMLASGANAEVYQMNLLKVSVPDLPLALSTNYNQSFLKKRIQMMNSKKSSARSTWKYLFILPMIGFSVALLNPTITSAQEESTQTEQGTQTEEEGNNDELNIVLPSMKVDIIPQTKIELNNKPIKLNSSFIKLDEIGDLNDLKSIKSLKGLENISMLNIDTEDLSINGGKGNITVTSKTGKIVTINNQNGRSIVRDTEEDIENEGIWEAEIRGNKVCVYIKKGGIDKTYFWSSTECMQTSDFSPSISKNTEGEFSITRDAGTLVLRGEFEDGKGVGRYTFKPDGSFVTHLKSQGFKVKEKKLIHFFLSDIDKEYFSFLKNNGYGNTSEDDILGMAIHGVNEDYIQDINGEFKKVNFDKPKADELIAMKIHDIDVDYIKSFGKELKQSLTVDQLISAAIHDVDPEYIKEFQKLGFSDMTFDNLISASIHDVEPNYVTKFKNAGFDNLSFDDLISASIHDVDPAYITAFEQAGLNNISFDNLISAAIHDIEPEFIKQFQAAGFKNLDFDDMVSAAIHDVDPDYIKEFKAAGLTDISFDDLIAASIHDVDPAYFRSFQDAGFKDLNFDDMVTASIHDVDPNFIKEFYKLGFDDLTFDNLITAAIHDIDINLIKGIKEAGYDDISFDDMTSIAIHDIEPEFIKGIKEAGLTNISIDDIISFGIHDIDVDDIKGLQELGFDLTADEMISAGIHNLTPRFVKKMQDKGHKNLTFEEYLKLKIHGF